MAEAVDEQRILLSQATAGMVLARPVISLSRKTLLCGPGAVLDDAIITKLMLRGIKRVYVQGTPLAARREQAGELIRVAVRRRFSRAADTRTMESLEAMLVRELERRERKEADEERDVRESTW